MITSRDKGWHWGKLSCLCGRNQVAQWEPVVISKSARGTLPFEKPSKSAAAPAWAQGDGTRQGVPHWEINFCPYGAAPGEKACPGWLDSPVCWAPWGISCGSASPGGDSQCSPQGTQAGPSSPAACPYRLWPCIVAAGQGSERGETNVA